VSVQDQVTRAEEEENCFVMGQELAAAKMSRQQAAQMMEEAGNRIKNLENELEETKKEALKRKTEQERLIETKNKDFKNLQENMSKVKIILVINYNMNCLVDEW
jgi:phosphorylcholine metabolism protein LicD